MTKEIMIKNTSITIIALSIMTIALQHFGYRVQNHLAGTIMLNLNIFVSFVLIVLIIRRITTVFKSNQFRLLIPAVLGLFAIWISFLEPFN